MTTKSSASQPRLPSKLLHTHEVSRYNESINYEEARWKKLGLAQKIISQKQNQDENRQLSEQPDIDTKYCRPLECHFLQQVNRANEKFMTGDL